MLSAAKKKYATRKLRISWNPVPRVRIEAWLNSQVIPLNWLPSAHLPTYLPTFVLVHRPTPSELRISQSTNRENISSQGLKIFERVGLHHAKFVQESNSADKERERERQKKRGRVLQQSITGWVSLRMLYDHLFIATINKTWIYSFLIS